MGGVGIFVMAVGELCEFYDVLVGLVWRGYQWGRLVRVHKKSGLSLAQCVHGRMVHVQWSSHCGTMMS